MKAMLALCSLVVLAAPCAVDLATAEAPCCFTNPRYAGTCEVIPEDDETCASILEYLNTQNSVGKSYCGNTIIRGGWEVAECDPEEDGAAAPTTVPGTCRDLSDRPADASLAPAG